MNNILGAKMVKWREAAELTQQDVAHHFGYSTPQFISNWERGVSRPPFQSIKKLASLYKIDKKEFANALEQQLISDYTIKVKKKISKIA